MARLNGLAWLEEEVAFDFLRTGEENINIVQSLATMIPQYVETTTGYPAALTAGQEPAELVKPLCLFLMQLWYNPDGTDARQLTRVIQSLEKAVRAYVVAERRQESGE